MKLPFIFAFTICTTFSFSQINLPLDFESGITTSNFTDFDGGVGSVVANPHQTGNNTSATCGQIVRNGGMVWAGSKINFSNTFDFSTIGGLSMKVYSDAPAGTQVKLKLEGGAGEYIADQVLKNPGTWETITFDLSTAPLDKTELVFMFDFNFLGDGSNMSTFLFDDITQVPALPAVDLDIDFENNSVVTEHFTNFEGGTATVLANPNPSGMNMSSSVGEIIRNGGEIWAGSKLILEQNLDVTVLPFISIDVYTTAPIGTPVRLKVEGSSAPVEFELSTTSSGEWERLIFDITGTPGDMNTIAFMFDFGNIGNGSINSTFYFDNIRQTDGSLTWGIEELSQDKNIVKVLDFLGRVTEFKSNTPLILIYSDGTIERVMKLED
jgi:hypothetical protein